MAKNKYYKQFAQALERNVPSDRDSKKPHVEHTKYLKTLSWEDRMNQVRELIRIFFDDPEKNENLREKVIGLCEVICDIFGIENDLIENNTINLPINLRFSDTQKNKKQKDKIIQLINQIVENKEINQVFETLKKLSKVCKSYTAVNPEISNFLNKTIKKIHKFPAIIDDQYGNFFLYKGQKSGDINALLIKTNDVVGKGGCGTVFGTEKIKICPYKNKWSVVSKVHHYVVKTIHESKNKDETQNEFEICKQALPERHPEMVQTEKTHYIKMHLLPGQDMKKFLENKELNFLAKLKLAVAAMNSVQELHSKGIRHLDVKTENMMVDDKVDGHQSTYRVTLFDFGFSRISSHPNNLEESIVTGWVGTPGYAHPIQANKQEMSRTRADIFSCVVVLCDIFQINISNFQLKPIPVWYYLQIISSKPDEMERSSETIKEYFRNLKKALQNDSCLKGITLSFSEDSTAPEIPESGKKVLQIIQEALEAAESDGKLLSKLMKQFNTITQAEHEASAKKDFDLGYFNELQKNDAWKNNLVFQNPVIQSNLNLKNQMIAACTAATAALSHRFGLSAASQQKKVKDIEAICEKIKNVDICSSELHLEFQKFNQAMKCVTGRHRSMFFTCGRPKSRQAYEAAMQNYMFQEPVSPTCCLK